MLQLLDKPSLSDLLRCAKTESPITVYFCRHGATVLNGIDNVSVDRERGWSNVPLTEEGRQQAIDAGVELKGKGIGAIVSSDLQRAVETAEIIGATLNLKPQFSYRLRPWGLGTFTDGVMAEVAPQIESYARNWPDRPVPEGESFNCFRLRAFEGVAAAIRKNYGSIVLVIAHTRIERLIAGWKAKRQPIDHSINLDAFFKAGDPTGGVICFTTTRQLLNGELDAKLTHTQADYGPGSGGEYCKTCKFSDHLSPPHCAFVDDIAKKGYCRLWKPSES